MNETWDFSWAMSKTGKKGSTRLITQTHTHTHAHTHTHTHTVPAHISVEHTSPLALTATRVPSSVTGADAVDVHTHKHTRADKLTWDCTTNIRISTPPSLPSWDRNSSPRISLCCALFISSSALFLSPLQRLHWFLKIKDLGWELLLCYQPSY